MTDKLKNFKEVYGISDSLLEAANKVGSKIELEEAMSLDKVDKASLKKCTKEDIEITENRFGSLIRNSKLRKQRVEDDPHIASGVKPNGKAFEKEFKNKYYADKWAFSDASTNHKFEIKKKTIKEDVEITEISKDKLKEYI